VVNWRPSKQAGLGLATLRQNNLAFTGQATSAQLPAGILQRITRSMEIGPHGTTD